MQDIHGVEIKVNDRVVWNSRFHLKTGTVTSINSRQDRHGKRVWVTVQPARRSLSVIWLTHRNLAVVGHNS